MNYRAEILLKRFLLSGFVYPISKHAYSLKKCLFLKEEDKAARQYFRELDKTEYASLEQLKGLQNFKLRRLIREAYENVPYYRNVMQEKGINADDIGSVEDLGAFPLLTKQTVRDHFDELLNKRFEGRELFKVSTGGTTGTPLHLLFDVHAKGVSLAHWERWMKYAGVTPDDRFIFVATDYMAYDNKYYEGSYSSDKYYKIASFGLNDQAMEKYWRHIEAFRPEYLRGFAFACYLFADFLVRRGISYSLKAVITSGDMLYPYFRETIEAAFNCEVFDHYGQNEDIVTANECKCHCGYHINMESSIVECLDENNLPVPLGKKGHIVGTQLENICMPLIRYDTSDIGSLTDEECPCGRKHIRIKELDGRTDDWITTRDNKKIGHQLSVTMKPFRAEIRETQFIQETMDLLIVRMVITDNYKEETQRQFEKNIRGQVGDSIDIRFEKVPEIPKTSRGKHRFIISKVSPVLPHGQ